MISTSVLKETLATVEPSVENTRNLVQLKDFLNIPKAPERKYKRNMKRPSFIITSEEWQRAEELKIEAKQENEKEKQKTKIERIEKKIQKQEFAAKKLKMNMKKTKQKKEARKTSSNSIKKLSDREDFSQKLTQPNDLYTEMDIESNIFLNETENVLLQSNLIENSTHLPKPSHIKINNRDINLDVSNDIILQKNDKTVQSKAVAKKTDNMCNSTEFKTVANISNDIVQKTNKNYFENDSVISGTCFVCLGIISEAHAGIQCSVCSRLYHVDCAHKQLKAIGDENSIDFTCVKSCSKIRC